jgi:hypothetical protein
MSNKINTLIKELNNLNIYDELLDIEQAIDLRDKLNFIINKYSKFFCIDSDSECDNGSPSSIIRSCPVLINDKNTDDENTDDENNYESKEYQENEEEELKTPTYDQNYNQNYNQSQNVNYNHNHNVNNSQNYSDYLNYNHNNFLDNTSYYYQNQNQNQHQNQYTTTNIPKSQEEKNLRHTEQYV